MVRKSGILSPMSSESLITICRETEKF